MSQRAPLESIIQEGSDDELAMCKSMLIKVSAAVHPCDLHHQMIIQEYDTLMRNPERTEEIVGDLKLLLSDLFKELDALSEIRLRVEAKITAISAATIARAAKEP